MTQSSPPRPTSRLETLQKFVERAPNDPFPRYGLAMELKNAGRLEESRDAFRELETRAPDYVAQYLMHHNLLVSLGDKVDARAVLERGIVVAEKKGDRHALGELEGALDALDE